MSSLRASIAAVLAVALAGCHTSPADLLDKPSPGNYVDLAAHNKYLDHPSPAVSGPAGFGLGVGTIIGIPVMVVALPFTLAFGIAAFSDDPTVSNLQVLGNAVAWPDAMCAVGGCYAFGALPALIVGDAPAKTGRAPARGPAPAAPVRVKPAPQDPGPPPGIDGDFPPVDRP